METSPTNSRSAVAARILDGVALFLLLVVVGLRPLVQEQPTTALASFARALGNSRGLDPTFSLLMTLMILTAALLTWAARVVKPRRWRMLGVEWGGAVLLVVAVASCFFASDRRIAINETANWLALPLLAMVAVQLLDDPRARSLLVAVIIASAATFAAKCVRQERYEFDDTIKSYNDMREKFWADQGVSLDDPQVTLFERRLHGREAFGYAAHSNVAGGYLMGTAFVAAAAVVCRVGGTPGLIWLGLAVINALVAAGLFATIWLTGSRGAMAAGLVGIVLSVVGWALHRRLEAHPRRWLVGGWIAALCVVAAVIAYGNLRGGLPTSSMKFRWGYWRNAMKLVAEHPWVGVGAGNFPNYYPSVKPVTDPEEVADPHDFLVTATAQWGIPGGLAVIAMIVGASIVCASRRHDDNVVTPSPPVDPDWLRSAGWIALWTAALAVVIFGIRRAYLGTGGDGGDIYADDSRIWIVFFLLAYVSRRTLGIVHVGARRGAARVIIGAGVLAMLLHACIEMTLFQYGSATTLMAMLALLGAGSITPAAAPVRRHAWAGFALTAIALLAVIWFAAIPTTRVVFRLTAARLAAQQSAPPAEVRARYQDAVDADPYDPNPPAEYAAWLLETERQSKAPMNDAIALARLAASRNPASPAVWRGLAMAEMTQFETTGDRAALQSALDAVRRAVARYPESPRLQLMLADTLERVASAHQGANRASALQAAADAYGRALDLDGKRDAREIRRFSDAQRAIIRAHLDAIRSALPPDRRGA